MDVGRPSRASNVTPGLVEKLRDKPELTHLTFNIPVELHTKLKVYASKRRKTIVGTLKELIAGLPD
jgi:hypothetical protein